MCVCIFIYVYMYICIYVCMYMCMYVCMYMDERHRLGQDSHSRRAEAASIHYITSIDPYFPVSVSVIWMSCTDWTHNQGALKQLLAVLHSLHLGGLFLLRS